MTQDTLNLIQTRYQSVIHHYFSPAVSDYYVGLYHGLLDGLYYSSLIDDDEYYAWWNRPFEPDS